MRNHGLLASARSGFCRRQDGTSAIEYAILSPLMLLILFGMIAHGVYLGASHSIQQITADAARTALLTPVMFLLAAFAIDEGSLYVERREAQGVADLAAIAAAAHISARLASNLDRRT